MALPSAQELAATPSAILAAEIVNVNAVLAARYAPNSTFSELVDSMTVLGKSETRVPFTELVSYRTRLYVAQGIQAAEPTGLGMLDVRFHGDGGRCRGWDS